MALTNNARARVLSLKHTQLLVQDQDFKTEIVARTEKHIEKGEKFETKYNQSPGFISWETGTEFTLNP